jgi:hypothetical protein
MQAKASRTNDALRRWQCLVWCENDDEDFSKTFQQLFSRRHAHDANLRVTVEQLALTWAAATLVLLFGAHNVVTVSYASPPLTPYPNHRFGCG